MGIFSASGALVLTALLVSWASLSLAGAAGRHSGGSLQELETRLEAVDEELAQLASMSLRTGEGSVGYRSRNHAEAESREWIEIDLGGERTIDEVVIVPAIWRAGNSEFLADGFPVAFRVLALREEGGEGEVIASFDEGDDLLPRISPLVIPVAGVRASRLRIEADVLSPSIWDGSFILQLSEILAFEGWQNVALGKMVEVSSPQDMALRRGGEELVNGFLPYLMDAASGEPSIAYVSETGVGETPSLSLDLGEVLPVSSINLHRVDLSDTVPQMTPSDFGLPRRLLVEGGEKADFSDAVLLAEFRVLSVYDAGPVLSRYFPERRCRYLRFEVVEPYIRPASEVSPGMVQLGFAEIEVFSRGRNVALRRSFQTDLDPESAGRLISSLTDGRNFYGEILPLRDWMGQLARRHDLEVERPLILEGLAGRYAQQRRNLVRMGWLVGLLSLGILFSIIVGRYLRLRAMSGVRERIAADLHDELGANLHTIGLLSDLAEEAKDDPATLEDYHRRIRSETERSGLAVRRSTNLLGSDGDYSGLVEDMHRAARRIMGKRTHEISIEGEDHLRGYSPRKCYDLLLFYKECLVNISRHSEATELKTVLRADKEGLLLCVEDNGQGMPAGEEESFIPPSLRRRARLLGARITVDSPGSEGVRIELNLSGRRWSFGK